MELLVGLGVARVTPIPRDEDGLMPPSDRSPGAGDEAPGGQAEHAPLPLRSMVSLSALAIPPIGATAAAAATLGAIGPLVATIAAVVGGCAVQAGILIHLALQIHRRHHSFGPCRGIGFLGLATAAAVLSTVATAISTPGTVRAVTGVSGTATVALTATLGMLFLPGNTHSARDRLRTVLDGLGVGACLCYAAWLLAGGIPGVRGRVPCLVCLITLQALAVALVAALRGYRYRRAALTCASGSVLTILGSAAMTVALTGSASTLATADTGASRLAGTATTGWLLTAALVQLAGPMAALAGARWLSVHPSVRRRPPVPAPSSVIRC